MATELEKNDTDPGSRDKTRILLKEAGSKLYEALVEINKLNHSDRVRRITYKKADAHLGIAINALELARIEMRKRKKAEPVKAEVPTGADVEPEQIA